MHTRRIAIVANRHRSWNPAASLSQQLGDSLDVDFIERLIHGLKTKYQSLVVLGVGCDAGVNRLIKQTCADSQVPFAELSLHTTVRMEPVMYELLLISRHAALLDVGEEFHIMVSPSRFSNVEDLVVRVQQAKKPYVLYGAGYEVVETANL